MKLLNRAAEDIVVSSPGSSGGMMCETVWVHQPPGGAAEKTIIPAFNWNPVATNEDGETLTEAPRGLELFDSINCFDSQSGGRQPLRTKAHCCLLSLLELSLLLSCELLSARTVRETWKAEWMSKAICMEAKTFKLHLGTMTFGVTHSDTRHFKKEKS